MGARTFARDRNNFDVIRLVLAFIVFTQHASLISGVPALLPLYAAPAREAVEAFFVVSGFLVWMSYERSASLRDYAARRVRRIYPAYVAVMLVAAVAGALVSGAGLATLWSREGAAYLAAHLTLLSSLHADLPGVFAGNAHSQVNGSLWSIKVEVGCYLLVPLLAWLTGRVGWMRVMLPIYLIGVLWMVWLHEPWSYQTPGQLSYFCAGATAYHYRQWLSTRWRWCGPLGIAGLATGLIVPQMGPILEPASLALTVAFAAIGAPAIGELSRVGDLSYGVYLVHWPVLQCLAATGAFASPWRGVAMAVAVTLVIALGCWHWVEKPWLRRDSHYRVPAPAAA